MESVGRIIKVAKNNLIKPTALYSAVAVLAARVLETEKNLSEIIIALDARQLCTPPIPFESVGSFSQTVSLNVPLESTSMGVIKIAKYLQSQIDSVMIGKLPLTKNLSAGYNIEEIIQVAHEITAKHDTFLSGICLSNLGSMRFVAENMRYFELERGMVTQHNGISPLMIVTYTTYRHGVFVLGYCEPLMSKKNVSLYVDEYKKIINSTVSEVQD
ncbi:hypothetical protein [Microbulbifer sp. VAAF005]|uniref:hypothetical protein n=1 Tax=Microbulbifer sp. VAAF005 TaxID=3034230 RepID=UPI0024ACFE3F|nr:hypothetical protein [Microbulbifer sp. VAAF005]WHI46244.1 hypothetical protein P0078_21395 [Microbulbifer sp. VAAF005]